MKKLSIGVIVAFLTVLVVGCGSDVVHVLPSKTGTWRSDNIAYTYYLNSVVDSTWSVVDNSTYTFEKGGAGTREDASGRHSFTWSVNADGDVATICTNSVTAQQCQAYLVVSSSKNAQTWKATIVGAVNGEWTEYVLSLTRI